MEMNKIFQGDCIEVLQTLPDNSIDLVVTDPPYGLSFMGKDWDKTLPPREAFEGIIRVLKPGALAFVMSSPRQDVLWRMLSMLEGVGFELTQSYIDWIYKTGFPKAYDVSKGIDKKFGLKRKVIHKYLHPTAKNGDRVGNKSPYQAEQHLDGSFDITKPTADLAKKWDGWKSQTGLKPAHEPILMVNKPFSESTIVDNVLKWGTGAINVDACRIPFGDNPPKEMMGKGYASLMKANVEQGFRPRDYYESQNGFEYNPSNKGRFPANLLVSDGAIDEEYEKVTDNRAKKIGKSQNLGSHGIYGQSGIVDSPTYGDSGYASRYFDIDAWAEHHGFLDVPKPSKAERDFGLQGFPLKNQRKQDGSWGSHEIFEVEGSGRKTRTVNRNYHPTVKPVKLMAYLIELGCPPDGVVLDPFMGSGTTCIAAKQLVRKYIGIELNPEYFEIAKARIAAYPNPLSWFE